MDKDRVKGAIKDAAGRAQRQAGEWTNNDKAQVKGATLQAEGKAQNARGKVKDAARDAKKELDQERVNQSEQSANAQDKHAHSHAEHHR